MHDDIGEALRLIFQGIGMLQACDPSGRQFTIDGRLVGDIGEVVAARVFAITLDKRSRKDHDAKTADGRRDVQVKATFRNSLTFTRVPDLYLGLKLSRDGGHEVVFNGPGHVISEAFKHRKGIGEKQLSFSIASLKKLDRTVGEEDRVPLRKTA